LPQNVVCMTTCGQLSHRNGSIPSGQMSPLWASVCCFRPRLQLPAVYHRFRWLASKRGDFCPNKSFRHDRIAQRSRSVHGQGKGHGPSRPRPEREIICHHRPRHFFVTPFLQSFVRTRGSYIHPEFPFSARASDGERPGDLGHDQRREEVGRTTRAGTGGRASRRWFRKGHPARSWDHRSGRSLGRLEPRQRNL
jgi:hypothetical protein